MVIEGYGRCLDLAGLEAEAVWAVVEDKEKADMGIFLGCKRDMVDEDARSVGRSSSSSNSASGVGGFVSMMFIRSRHTAWKPPCSQARSP
jgi:hypothetical protein